MTIVHRLGQPLEHVCTFCEKCLLLVGKVNYDRPFMAHIERKIRQYFLLKMANKVNYDRPLVKYDRPLINYDRPLLGYKGRKNDLTSKVKYDRNFMVLFK